MKIESRLCLQNMFFVVFIEIEHFDVLLFLFKTVVYYVENVRTMLQPFRKMGRFQRSGYQIYCLMKVGHILTCILLPLYSNIQNLIASAPFHFVFIIH